MSVSPNGYQGLTVTWYPPGTPGQTWSAQMLLRSSFGTPISIDDGVVLLNESAQSAGDATSTSFVDSPGTADSDSSGVPLKSGHFYYYGLFVYDTTLDEWVLSASAQGLVLTKWGFGDKFVIWLPEWYFTQDSRVGSPNTFGLKPSLVGYGPLFRYLQLLGFEMDWIRSEIESLFTLTNPTLISGTLLPYLGANFGMAYEPELGMGRSRVLVQNAVRLYQQRGTAQGIAAAASAFSGFGCVVTLGPNLEIQLDDCAFDQSAGHWTNLTNCTLVPVSAASVGVSPLHTAYLPPNNTNVGLLTAVGAGDVEFSTCNPVSAPQLGIPVDATYLASLATSSPLAAPNYQLSAAFCPYPQATPVEREWAAKIDWYADNGAYLSSSVGTTTSEAAGIWTTVSVVGSPPSGAVWFGRSFESTAALSAGERHLVDAEMVLLS